MQIDLLLLLQKSDYLERCNNQKIRKKGGNYS